MHARTRDNIVFTSHLKSYGFNASSTDELILESRMIHLSTGYLLAKESRTASFVFARNLRRYCGTFNTLGFVFVYLLRARRANDDENFIATWRISRIVQRSWETKKAYLKFSYCYCLFLFCLVHLTFARSMTPMLLFFLKKRMEIIFWFGRNQNIRIYNNFIF